MELKQRIETNGFAVTLVRDGSVVTATATRDKESHSFNGSDDKNALLNLSNELKAELQRAMFDVKQSKMAFLFFMAIGLFMIAAPLAQGGPMQWLQAGGVFCLFVSSGSLSKNCEKQVELIWEELRQRYSIPPETPSA